MTVQSAARPRGTRRQARERADLARRRLAHLTLWFPIAGTAIILVRIAIVLQRDGAIPDGMPNEVAVALVQLWGLYGPYLLAITAYLWAQQKVETGAEKTPNGWQMSVLAHSFTMKLILLVYSGPLLIYAIADPTSTANKVMAIYQSAVHTITAGAITYFFARPEQDAAPRPTA
ncbi:MAG TPA: hypothetical protein VFT45_09400 [Longimicrobium sp.]|nr:hypothetical protein [Longimicrobium sp.]